jgi:hypothetical protein
VSVSINDNLVLFGNDVTTLVLFEITTANVPTKNMMCVLLVVLVCALSYVLVSHILLLRSLLYGVAETHTMMGPESSCY